MALHAVGSILFGILSFGPPPLGTLTVSLTPAAARASGAAAHAGARSASIARRQTGYAPATSGTLGVASSLSAARVDEPAVSQMLAAINRERLANGRPPLVSDDRLAALACAHALDMAARDYFSHETPEGLSPFDRMARADYPFDYAGENMALDSNAGAADQALWNSPEHRSNTLEPHFAHVGIAAVKTAQGELFVEDFSD